MRIAVNALAGLIFGLGLLISGMANPAKVQNFLDLAGTFDPSLDLRDGRRRRGDLPGYRFAFSAPAAGSRRAVLAADSEGYRSESVLGAGLFGIGWGLSGFCPGPAITSLPLLAKGTLVFVPTMRSASAWRVASWSGEGHPEKPPLGRNEQSLAKSHPKPCFQPVA